MPKRIREQNQVQWPLWLAAAGVCCFLCFGAGYYVGRGTHRDYGIYPVQMTSVFRENPYAEDQMTNFSDSSIYPININTADTERLELLPNIGETKAAAIVAYREEYGAFGDKEELLNVPGIGEGTLEEIEDLICINDYE
ncbi:MAG: ComEA family DNA-binding protein [Oscillospiraceae bacterium]|nr:ComEA family DNA-binding protein [Oscillospiraceae bacterium]MBR1845507.1 ComEA family DNA-binding protein [Oscillospiraceae bacterium]